LLFIGIPVKVAEDSS